MTILLLTPEGIYVSRDRLGRTPAMIGKKEGVTNAAKGHNKNRSESAVGKAK